MTKLQDTTRSMNGITLAVHPFIVDCTEKEQACKVLEEAAEVFGAWQILFEDYLACIKGDCVECWYLEVCTPAMSKHVADKYKRNLADEIADVIQAACNLAERYGIDVGEAMERCTERQRARGRL